jgi:hypothetical protein
MLGGRIPFTMALINIPLSYPQNVTSAIDERLRSTIPDPPNKKGRVSRPCLELPWFKAPIATYFSCLLNL